MISDKRGIAKNMQGQENVKNLKVKEIRYNSTYLEVRTNRGVYKLNYGNLWSKFRVCEWRDNGFISAFEFNDQNLILKTLVKARGSNFFAGDDKYTLRDRISIVWANMIDEIDDKKIRSFKEWGSCPCIFYNSGKKTKYRLRDYFIDWIDFLDNGHDIIYGRGKD